VAYIGEQGEEGLRDLLHLGIRLGQRANGQERAQEVQQRRIGAGAIGRKATALQKQKVVRGRIGFDLSHQAGFANACFTGNQSNLSLTAFRSIDEQAEGGEIMRATDQDRTNDWGSKLCLHSVGLSADKALLSEVYHRVSF